jgi:cytochrome c oxidase subunit 4
MSHNVNPRNYALVLGALLVLTVLTVGVSQVNFGGKTPNYVVGVIIAVVKATLVVLFFMHLKYEHRTWAVLVLFPLLLVMIIIFSNLTDTGYGDFTHPPEKQIKQPGKAGPAH